jgi:hypothetical protein
MSKVQKVKKMNLGCRFFSIGYNSFIDEVLFRLYKFLDEKTERPWFYTELKK